MKWLSFISHIFSFYKLWTGQWIWKSDLCQNGKIAPLIYSKISISNILRDCYWPKLLIIQFCKSHFLQNWISWQRILPAQLPWKLGSWLNRQMQNFLQLSQMRGNWKWAAGRVEAEWWRHLLLLRLGPSMDLAAKATWSQCVSKIQARHIPGGPYDALGLVTNWGGNFHPFLLIC